MIKNIRSLYSKSKIATRLSNYSHHGRFEYNQTTEYSSINILPTLTESVVLKHLLNLAPDDNLICNVTTSSSPLHGSTGSSV